MLAGGGAAFCDGVRLSAQGFLASSVCIGDEGGWRVIYGLAALPALATAAGVTTLLPESPRWLLLRGGGEASAREKALGALTRLRGTYAASFLPSFTTTSDPTRAFVSHSGCARAREREPAGGKSSSRCEADSCVHSFCFPSAACHRRR